MIETLAKSLNMAVETCFDLEDIKTAEVNQKVAQCDVLGLENILHAARVGQRPGLKTEVAEALASGCVETVSKMELIAQDHALVAAERKAARFAVQNFDKDSRMRRDQQLIEWNELGYAL